MCRTSKSPGIVDMCSFLSVRWPSGERIWWWILSLRVQVLSSTTEDENKSSPLDTLPRPKKNSKTVNWQHMPRLGWGWTTPLAVPYTDTGGTPSANIMVGKYEPVLLGVPGLSSGVCLVMVHGSVKYAWGPAALALAGGMPKFGSYLHFLFSFFQNNKTRKKQGFLQSTLAPTKGLTYPGWIIKGHLHKLTSKNLKGC